MGNRGIARNFEMGFQKNSIGLPEHPTAEKI